MADVDGDGVSEFIMKRNYVDGSSVDATAFNLLECYNIQGDRLWYIDLGPNMVSGPDEQYDAVGYDWDGDGKAEILLRGADNMIIYHSDGTKTNIGNMSVNTRGSVTQTANMTYTNQGVSMEPLLHQGRDLFTVAKKGPERCKKYDVVLYKRGKGKRYILHRILKVLPDGYLIAGDHLSVLEKDIKDENILGVMTRIIRNGKEITPDNKLYKLYINLWCRPYHIRMLYLRIEMFFKRCFSFVKRRVFKR